MTFVLRVCRAVLLFAMLSRLLGRPTSLTQCKVRASARISRQFTYININNIRNKEGHWNV